jgi:hypothetical protein
MNDRQNNGYYPLVSFVHCFFCPSLIHAFLLPLGIFCPLLCLFVIDLRLLITPWYLLSIVLSVFHWLTSSYYALVSFVHCFFCPSLIYPFLLPLGIFCPLFFLSFIDLHLLITPWYLLSIVFSVLHWFTPSYYPSVSFVHCFVCPSLIYTEKTMDKRYQGVIRRCKSMKDGQSNGQKIPSGNKKAWINEGQKKQWTKDTKV